MATKKQKSSRMYCQMRKQFKPSIHNGFSTNMSLNQSFGIQLGVLSMIKNFLKGRGK